jgi:hypothetical protein
MLRFASPFPVLLSGASVLLSGIMLLGAQQSSSTGSQPATPNAQSAPPQGAPAQAQQKRPNIPDIYTNLKVLPADIKKPDLLAIMKAFCIERKIRCSQCHNVSDDLTEGEFASDDKPTKIAAREFLKTVFDARAKYPFEGKMVPAAK